MNILKSPDFRQVSDEKHISINDDEAMTLDLQEPVKDTTETSRTFKSGCQSPKSVSTLTYNLRIVSTDGFKIKFKYLKMWKKYIKNKKKYKRTKAVSKVDKELL
mmetsp:Transcript_17373/g.19481  ORF Transcript_17373/g.19481 Transcript_17373/m.19481 type:complete len:104 (-) Transcript_17373:330-641(-)